MNLSFIPDLYLKGKQNQQQMQTFAMQQSLHVLQLPLFELGEYVAQEVEDNSLLQWEEGELFREERDPSQEEEEEKMRAYRESLVRERPSLFQHVMQQAHLSFSSHEDLKIAEKIAGNLDERGFLNLPLTQERERAVLEIIQTFDPTGIGAQNLRHSLLLQLRAQGQEESLATSLLSRHYDLLLKNNLPLLQRKIGCPLHELQNARSLIASLNFSPGALFSSEINRPVTVDLFLDHDGEKWTIRLSDEEIPPFRLAGPSRLPPKDFSLIRNDLARAKWLINALYKREKTLRRIADFLIRKQERFLLGDRRICTPMTLQEMAQDLRLHESTITRAVAHKYLFCPAGLFLLRSLFSSGKQEAAILLRDLIKRENKQAPLSDETLSLKLSAQGCDIARRTVAKYRNKLRIAPASQRRALNDTRTI